MCLGSFFIGQQFFPGFESLAVIRIEQISVRPFFYPIHGTNHHTCLLYTSSICDLYGCTFHLDKTWNGLPVLVNDKSLTEFVKKNATDLLGEHNVIPMDHLTLGEDFAIYLEKIPGVFWVLGICPPEQESMRCV